MKIFTLILISLFYLPAYADDVVWNRWETENFVIVSLDESKGIYLAEHIEDMRKWALTRWGFPNVKFESHCYIFCVNDRNSLFRFFGITETHGEIVLNDDSDIDGVVLWVILDGHPREVVLPPITYAGLMQVGQQYNVKMPMWSLRGLGYLNSTPEKIKEKLLLLNREHDFSSRNFFNITQDDWLVLDKEKRDVFDAQAIAFCLFLYNEGGPSHLRMAIQQGLNRTDHKKFDEIFSIYLKNLGSDVSNNVVPDFYLRSER